MNIPKFDEIQFISNIRISELIIKAESELYIFQLFVYLAMDYEPPKTPELWQPYLTQFPTSNVACINCCKIVRTVTT